MFQETNKGKEKAKLLKEQEELHLNLAKCENISHQQQNQIVELQRKIQFLEGERAAYHESSQVTIQKNREEIRQMRRENESLRKKLADQSVSKAAFQNRGLEKEAYRNMSVKDIDEGLVTTKLGSCGAAVLADLLTKRRDKADVDAKTEERKQVLKSLQQHVHQMQKRVEEVEKLGIDINMFIKSDHIIEKAESERRKGLEMKAEIDGLKEQHTQLIERKQKLQHQVQRQALYGDFMKRAVRMTKFEQVQSFMVHLENLLHLRDQLYEKEKTAQKEVDQLKKALQKLEDQHRLLQMDTLNQLSQLQSELDITCSEALTWESKWNHLLETAAKKKLLLVKIKMVTLNLYELTDDKAEEEESVNMNDTEKQLDKVKMFIQDHSLAQAQFWTEKTGQDKNESQPTGNNN